MAAFFHQGGGGIFSPGVAAFFHQGWTWPTPKKTRVGGCNESADARFVCLKVETAFPESTMIVQGQPMAAKRQFWVTLNKQKSALDD